MVLNCTRRFLNPLPCGTAICYFKWGIYKFKHNSFFSFMAVKKILNEKKYCMRHIYKIYKVFYFIFRVQLLISLHNVRVIYEYKTMVVLILSAIYYIYILQISLYLQGTWFYLAIFPSILFISFWKLVFSVFLFRTHLEAIFYCLCFQFAAFVHAYNFYSKIK